MITRPNLASPATEFGFVWEYKNMSKYNKYLFWLCWYNYKCLLIALTVLKHKNQKKRK